jgi:hypothetical protein
MTEVVAMKIQNPTKTKMNLFSEFIFKFYFKVQVAVITLLGNATLLPCRVTWHTIRFRPVTNNQGIPYKPRANRAASHISLEPFCPNFICCHEYPLHSHFPSYQHHGNVHTIIIGLNLPVAVSIVTLEQRPDVQH